MCIAIFKPASVTLSDETLENCFENNSDGCGFAYIKTDTETGSRSIVIKKTMIFFTFLQEYKQAILESPESNFLIHFRIKTHGETSVFNCHPFSIDDNHCFIHNGIIRGMTVDARKSDTQMFNEDYLQLLPEGWMTNPGISKLIEAFIDYNKIVVMNINGDVQIYNEKKGEWKDGAWYSNNGYKKRVYTSTSYVNNRTTAFNRSPHTPTVIPITKPSAPKVDIVTTPVSKCKCEFCGKIFQVKDMFHYYLSTGECRSYCSECLGNKDLNAKHLQYPISDGCFMDWKNSKGYESRMDYDVHFNIWSNPWGGYGSEVDADDFEDLSEMYA